MANDRANVERDAQYLRQVTGCPDVYFDSMPGAATKCPVIKMKYSGIVNICANNKKYLTKTVYILDVVEREKLGPIYEVINALPTTKYTTMYVADGMVHNVFTWGP